MCHSAHFLWNIKEISLPTDKKQSKKLLNQQGQKEGLWSPRNNLPFLQHTLYERFMLMARACPFVADSLFLYHNNTYFPLCSLWRRKEIPFFVHRAVESFVSSLDSTVQGWQCWGMPKFMAYGIWAWWNPGVLGRFLFNSISTAVSSCTCQEDVDREKAITDNTSSKPR